ncbi:hypothetical protein DF039_05465 [Burkholderia cenocepacia]|nr:hypothetical protein DF132_30450 [Burkholderia cenocepacia]RQV26144.1 hypothetical protein DF039_05465 [Burkholderia cenocepacia]
MLYGVASVKARPLEDPPRYFAAHVLVEVHLPNSVDRTPESRIGNDAMLVVLPVGWRGCGIAQLVNCSLWIVIEISP